MQFTIPANCPESVWGDMFWPFCNWLQANGVDPAYIDGTQLLTVTDVLISGTAKPFGPFQVDVTAPMSPAMGASLMGIFFSDTSTTDAEAVPMDDMAHLYQQLATARRAAADAKKSADEARDQILARLRESGKEYGAIAGQRVLYAKVIPKSYFNKAECAADNPGLIEKYTTERTETRLEIL
jgi:hypothetical protein